MNVTRRVDYKEPNNVSRTELLPILFEAGQPELCGARDRSKPNNYEPVEKRPIESEGSDARLLFANETAIQAGLLACGF